MASANQQTAPGELENPIDAREALFNGGVVGPIKHIQVSTERVVRLDGMLYDLDPDIMKAGSILDAVPNDPAEFYAAVVRPMLNRHLVLKKAEVRNSGRGIHAILRFDKPIEFTTDGERERWSGIVKVVQAALPIDPDQPGITATTRAVGSTNSKNGAEVTILAEGEPVTVDEVLKLYDEMTSRPFRTVLNILAGSEVREPCPVCGKDGTRLSASDRIGHCYGSCGNVKVEQLYELVLAPRIAGKEAKSDA